MELLNKQIIYYICWMAYKDKEKRKKANALWLRRKKLIAREEILSLLGEKCKCGFSDKRALTIDHKNGGGAKERKAFGGRYYFRILEKIKRGENDYQILCCNCNQIKSIENDELSTNRKWEA